MGSLLQLTALVFVFLLVYSEAYIPEMHFGRPKGGFLKPPRLDHLSQQERLRIRFSAPLPEWFEQKLDHFNPEEIRRWKQRYFAGNKSAKSKRLFVFIGGEGPADPTWNVVGSFADYAKEYDAVTLQLEHRYYGKSHPTPNTTVANLQYLSSEQALADLAAFITAKKEEFSAKQVIVFGGSYSGCLSAWFRLKYPHLADGAVSSSAPVLAKVDFEGYLEVVKNSLDYFYKKGDCSKAISDATAEMETDMKTAEGRLKLKKILNLCEDIDPTQTMDVDNLYMDLAGTVMGKVQYNPSDQKSTRGINGLCKTLTDESIGSPLERYAKVQGQSRCLNFSYSKMIESYKDVAWSDAVGGRAWTYQTCVEFGYYQSTDSDNQPFGHTVPVEWFTQQCSDIFGPQFNTAFVQRAVQQTNIEYGARKYGENKVVFVNGGIDPWHWLSITHSLPNAPSIFIPNTAHCANMLFDMPTDPPELRAARVKVGKLIGQWLNQAP